MSGKRTAPMGERRIIKRARKTAPTRGIKVKVKADPAADTSHASTTTNNTSDEKILRTEFIDLFSRPQFRRGISNPQLKTLFGHEKFLRLAPIINSLTHLSRLSISKNAQDDELLYNLVSDVVASKFAGLDATARMVYQVIEKAENMGIWTKDIKYQTSIPQQALNKIYKSLEGRKLIKPVKAVTAKQKKLYMLYDLVPAKEITGGPWYTTELEFDHEFISELRKFVIICVKQLNKGKGVTLKEIAKKMEEANISRVPLNLQEVQQLMQTLAFDYLIEPLGVDRNKEVMFISARKITTNCEFKSWEVLAPDFHFRDIEYEDGVVLKAHEPHYHTA